ncbi:MAG TPA: IclR family transcriptional regulator [Salinarimonas sp.]|nr:IclR family transcriptional regulator [Salinarimonas sp.]
MRSPSSLQRGLSVLRALAEVGGNGARLKDLAAATGLSTSTLHRLLGVLVEEGLAERCTARSYRLSVGFFTLAAGAGNPDGLRELCRPVLLRLSSTLSDTTFLLVRSGYDAVCLDRCEGPFPIRSFTNDVGGRVPLGVGQGPLVLLAHLPPEERDEVIRFNVPRLVDLGVYDEVYLRTEIDKVLAQGYASRETGLIPGMTGVAVPVMDRRGSVVAALSIGTLLERLKGDRLPTVVHLLKAEAAALGARVSPFDPATRRPNQVLGASVSREIRR